MEPDNRKRNIIVGSGYVLLLLVILANFASIIALLLLLSPVIAAVLIGKNYKGSASEMARLPGIEDGGGIQAGISAFVYTIVFVGVLMGGISAFAPVDEAPEEDSEVSEGEGEAEAEATEEEAEADEAAEDEMSTVTITVVDENSDPIENADVEFIHDDAIIFDTRENKPTNSEGIVKFETDTGSNVEINVEADGYETTDASLTVSEDEEITLTLQEEPEDTEQDTEPAEEDSGDASVEEETKEDTTEETESTEQEQQNTETEASEDSGSDGDGESDSDESGENTASDSSDSADETESSDAGIEVRISYSGDWSGSVGGDGTSSSVEGSGDETIPIDGDPATVAATIQKQDDSSDELTVAILEDGEVIVEESTTAEYGVVSVSEAFF